MAKELAPGDRAPAFQMPTDSEGEISSSALKGQPYVLYFYPKDDTAGCTREAMEFSAAKKKFEAQGVAIVGVSKDTATSHDRFKNKHKLRITLASDAEIKFAQIYGVWGEKTLYGRKYMGMERATFLVDAKGVIRHVWRKVKVPGHVEAVLAAAKTL
jgi:peroxiredoxin Q/BCP